MMVYPNQVILSRNWTTNTGIDILLALGEGDGLYIYNTSSIDNEIELGMPSEVVNCEVGIRSDNGFPQLLMEFFLAGNFVGSAILPTTSSWVTHTLTVDRWDRVVLTTMGNGIVGVDFLRADPFGGLPTRRTLTGVGI